MSTYGSKSTPFTLRVVRSVFRVLGNIAPGLTGRLAMELFSMPLKRTQPAFDSLPPDRTIDVPFQQGHIRSYVWGDGPAVLFVHGWESNGGRFSHFIKPMLDAGYRVVIVDGHAHGASSGRSTNYLLFSDALKAAIDHIGGIYALVAHSFGTGASMTLLDRYPDLNPERIVLLGPVNRLMDMTAMFAKMVHLPGCALERMHRHIVNRVGRELNTFDVDYIASRRHESALVIHDEEDRVLPFKEGKAVAEAWPGATFLATKGLGHRRMLKSDVIIKETVGFLGE